MWARRAMGQSRLPNARKAHVQATGRGHQEPAAGGCLLQNRCGCCHLNELCPMLAFVRTSARTSQSPSFIPQLSLVFYKTRLHIAPK